MTPRKRLRRLLLLASGALALGLVAAWIVGGKLVEPCPRHIGAAPADLPAEVIALASDSGSTLAGWHIDAHSGAGAIVLLHPLRESRLKMLARARLLYGAGYSIVMVDLQAHGESPGQHLTLGDLERYDARAAVEFARAAHPGEPLGVLGVSLGGAAALLASPLDIDALVLESVFPTIDAAVHDRVAAQLGPLSWIPAELLLVQLDLRLGIERSALRPIDYIADTGCATFVISGMDDRHTTPAETREMFAAAREPKQLWLVEGAAHVDLYRAAGSEYEARLLAFFRAQLGPRD